MYLFLTWYTYWLIRKWSLFNYKVNDQKLFVIYKIQKLYFQALSNNNAVSYCIQSNNFKHDLCWKIVYFFKFAATCTTIIRCTLECLSGPSVLWFFVDSLNIIIIPTFNFWGDHTTCYNFKQNTHSELGKCLYLSAVNHIYRWSWKGWIRKIFKWLAVWRKDFELVQNDRRWTVTCTFQKEINRSGPKPIGLYPDRAICPNRDILLCPDRAILIRICLFFLFKSFSHKVTRIKVCLRVKYIY